MGKNNNDSKKTANNSFEVKIAKSCYDGWKTANYSQY